MTHRTRFTASVVALFLLLLLLGSTTQAVTIDWVTVGNPGNANEHIQTDVLPAGRYYVRIQRVSGSSQTQPYALQAIYR